MALAALTAKAKIENQTRLLASASSRSIVSHSPNQWQGDAMESREIKGLEIAAKSQLTHKGNTWLVPSQNSMEKYSVGVGEEKPNCTCRDFEFRNDKCKHIFAVEYTIEREKQPDGHTVVTETVKVTRKTYAQNWPAYNAAQTHEKSELQALLYELCQSLPEPEQKRGRPRLSLADIIFSSTYKVRCLSSRSRLNSPLTPVGSAPASSCGGLM
jgi:hypothetical protein